MLRWGSSARAQDGDEVSVVSNPLGQLPGTLSKGIVSASRVVNGTRLLQISAPISHGSSGAPLLNSQGQVIGVIRSTMERGQALNFATATDAIRNMQTDPAAVAEAQTMLRKPTVASRAEPPPASRSARAGGPTRTIAVGQSVGGDLTSDDELYPDTSYFQRWQLSTVRGQDVTIDLASSDFDPVLIVRGETSDLLSAKTANRMLAKLSKAELVTVPGIGHAPILEEPEAAAGIDRLLEKVLAEDAIGRPSAA